MDSWEEQTMELSERDILDVDVADALHEDQWFAEGELLGLLY